MVSSRQQVVHLYNALVHYLTHNHVQGEELVALEEIKVDLHDHLKDVDALPVTPVAVVTGEAGVNGEETLKKKGKKKLGDAT